MNAQQKKLLAKIKKLQAIEKETANKLGDAKRELCDSLKTSESGDLIIGGVNNRSIGFVRRHEFICDSQPCRTIYHEVTKAGTLSRIHRSACFSDPSTVRVLMKADQNPTKLSPAALRAIMRDLKIA